VLLSKLGGKALNAILKKPETVASDAGDNMLLVEILKRFLPENHIDLARKEQAVAHKKLGDILLERSLVAPEILAKCIAEQANLRHFSIIDIDSIQDNLKVDKEFIHTHKIVPISDDGETVEIGVTDPFNRDTKHAVSRYFNNRNIKFAVISSESFQRYLESRYIISASEIVRRLDDAADVNTQGHGDGLRLLLKKAVVERCSDIHIECSLDGGRIKLRKNGRLFLVAALTASQYDRLVNQTKLNASVDITNPYKPLDGRIEGKFLKDSNYLATDFRVSIMPNQTKDNPKPSVVIRVLDRRTSILPLEDLGIAPHVLDFLHKAKKKPHGMIIITGPTGSGKSTTIYSTVSTIDTIEKNFMSVEDPVEYRNYLWKQIQVDDAHGMSFAASLRSILRHDPDIIFCGEMRDEESAKIAFDMANTGHLVFTTLHANDAVGAIPRLQGLGVQNSMIEAAVIGTVSQRLARVLCKCKELHDDPKYGEVYIAKGCEVCNHTGYKGRIMVSEYFPCNMLGENEILALALGGNILKARTLAAEKYSDMKQDMKQKVLNGLTTVAELEEMF
jgi:type II secretory ATPase GspE/PulE/Tfp pilus assembly ATPase PilB-like protein